MTQRQDRSEDSLSAASWDFAEDFIPVDESIAHARQAAVTLGIEAPSLGTLTALRLFARLVGATSVVEVGTGAGSTGLALFEGMQPNGVLTSIDAEPERQAEARRAFVSVGIRTQRFRLIAGTPLDVLPKLRDGAYDLVFINGDKLEYVEYVAQALRLLRHGGIVILNNALWRGLVADPANEDDETLIIREALQSVQLTEEFTSALLPVGDGLLVAAKA